ncbi:MAG: amino acid adenylation domain-containing protein [Fusobacteriota bacterium]
MNPKNLIEVLKNLKDERKKGITFIGGGKDDFLSYHELYKEALKFIHILRTKGMVPNDELVFQVDDNKSFLIAFWGCILGGIIPVPVKVGANDEERIKLIKIWNTLRNPYLLTKKSVMEKMEKFGKENGKEKLISSMKKNTLFLSECNGDKQGEIFDYYDMKIGFIQFSSGSTGDPKGAVLLHKNLITNIKGIAKGVGIRPHDKQLSWMPLTHDMGLIMLHLTATLAGIQQYIIKTSTFVRRPILWLEKANEYRATLLSSPNFGYKYFMKYFKSKRAKNWDLSCVRLIYNGAEPISAKLCHKFIDKMKKYGLKKKTMFPAYGLAEACVVVSLTEPNNELITYNLNRNKLGVGDKIQEVSDNDPRLMSFVDVGKSIEGTELRIVDDENEVLPEDIVGHIQIRGGNVMWGYYRNKEATSRVFSHDQWLYTGDLGFVRNESLCITGREKDVIFVNGQNYYAHDIERVAQGVPEIELGNIAVSGAYNKDKEEEDIIVFIKYKRKLSEFIELKTKLRKHINLHTGLKIKEIIPARIMPKTTSGKVQRFKLKNEYLDGKYDDIIKEMHEMVDAKIRDKDYKGPQNYTEKVILHIWQDLLQKDKIYMDDNFFELGGDSLNILYMASEIHKYFDVDIPIGDLFELNTIKKIEKYIEESHKKEFREIPVYEERDYYPMSDAQKRMFILNKFDTSKVAYNNPFILLVKGKMNKRKLYKTLHTIVNRHEALRTGFEFLDGKFYQKVYDDIYINIMSKKVDLLPVEMIAEDFIKPFDLEKPPLFRVEILEYHDNRSLLLFDMHHIITDGASIRLFIKELNELYLGKKLPKMRIQYKDFTIWQRNFFETEEYKKQESYWLSQFQGELPVLNMPTDKQRPPEQTFEGYRIREYLDEEFTKNLRDFSEKNGVTLYMLMFAAYKVLLNKYTSQDDIIVGTPTSGRSHSDLQDMMGVFVNTLAIRSNPGEEKSFLNYLEEIKSLTLEGSKNSDYPFERLVEKVSVERNVSRNPIFDTLFAMSKDIVGNIEIKGLEFENYEFEKWISLFDFSMEIIEDNQKLKLHLDYAKSLFEESTMKRFVRHYVNLLKNIMQNPQSKIKNLEIMDEKERKRILYDFNDTTKDYPKDKTVHEIFEKQVGKNPDKVAVVFENSEMTYDELNKKANRLAWTLHKKGVKPDDIIGIMIERSLEMVVGILAILKSGGAYLPIDPEYPEDRIEYMLEDSESKLLLTKSDVMDKASNFSGEIVMLDDQKSYADREDNLEKKNKPTDLIYVIYTSGSTGRPKGVMVEHQSVINVLEFLENKYPLKENGSYLLKTNFVFDVSVSEIFGWFFGKGKLVILKPGYEKDPIKILKVIQNKKVTHINFTPSMLNAFLLSLNNDEKIEVGNLKYVFSAGEAITKDLIENFYTKIDGVNLENLYGPTETTMYVTSYSTNRSRPENVFIGKPISNVKSYIIDEDGRPMALGIPGELCFSGECLARKYNKKDELTEEKFFINKYINNERMYRTGDLALITENGNIEYLGRMDNQVKVRGYRIELDEINSWLLRIEDIKESVVIVYEENGNKVLAA